MNRLPLLQDALRAFSVSTGLQLTQLEPERYGERCDAMLELQLPKRRLQFVAELKRIADRPAILSRVKANFHDTRHHPRYPLLITHYLTPALADDCRRLELNFIDTAGNCFISADDLVLLVKGNKVESTGAPAENHRGGTSASGLRMIFALACKPELLAASYREVTEAAGVALGSVGWIFRDLESRGLISRRDRNKRRHFLNLPRLQEEWAVNYPHKLRPKLNSRRFSAAEPDWWSDYLTKPAEFLWGGEVGSALMDGHLKPATQTLYVGPSRYKEVIARLGGRHRWRADPAGPIEVLERFWNFDTPAEGVGIAPPLLIYSDLLATLNSRAAEAAALVKKNHLDATSDSS